MDIIWSNVRYSLRNQPDKLLILSNEVRGQTPSGPGSFSLPDMMDIRSGDTV